LAEIKDETLAARAAKGDMQAFEELVNRHRTSVYRLARSITGNHDDADDAAQETFIRVHRSLSSFDTGRSFRPWLRRIAYNTSLNVLRGVTNRKKRIAGSETDRVPDLSPDPEQAAQNRDSGYHIQTAVDSLTAELRATIVLRASEGMSYQDIAKTTGVKIGTVMSRLSRARERIQASMEAGGKLEQGGDVS
jgi:RNA polymerase sigma-70 factor (ECF subfamily)